MDLSDASAQARGSVRPPTAASRPISRSKPPRDLPRTENVRGEFIQSALTHHALNTLGAREWNVRGVEDARQAVKDWYGHRDGPNKQRRPSVEMRLLDGARWQDLPRTTVAALIDEYFFYLDVDSQRGPSVFGDKGWEAVAAARDLLVERPSTIAALDPFKTRSAYSHPVIKRRIDSVHNALTSSASTEDGAAAQGDE